jgi:pilus assembly protein CpaE
MHIAFASPAAWTLPDAFTGLAGYRTTSLVASAEELPAQLASILPDVVVLNYDEASLREIVAQIAKTSRRTLAVPCTASPSPQFLVELMRMGIIDILMEDDAEALVAILTRIAQSNRVGGADVHLDHAKRIAFLAAKGGTGSTFLLSNFATQLARDTGGQVLIVDLSIPFGDIDIYLIPEPAENDLSDFVLQVDRIDKALLDAMVHHVAGNLDLIPSPTTMERVLQIAPADVVKLLAKIDEFYDYIVFDLGDSIDQFGLPMIETLDQLVLVSRPDLPSARRTSQTIRLLADLDFPDEKLVVVSNAFGIRKPVSLHEYEKAIGHAIRYEIPDAGQHVAIALVENEPVIEIAPKSPFAKAIQKWVAGLSGSEIKGKKLWRIFGTN